MVRKALTVGLLHLRSALVQAERTWCWSSRMPPIHRGPSPPLFYWQRPVWPGKRPFQWLHPVARIACILVFIFISIFSWMLKAWTNRLGKADLLSSHCLPLSVFSPLLSAKCVSLSLSVYVRLCAGRSNRIRL